MANQQQKPNPGLRKLAYISAVVGGGVVGVDYATWLGVPYWIGAPVGSAISAGITNVLLKIQEDRGGKIREACTTIGVILGMIAGVYVGLSNWDGLGAFFGGLVVGGILGGAAGQIIAGIISLSAFFLLFISRGPIGFFLRELILSPDSEIGATFIHSPDTLADLGNLPLLLDSLRLS